MGFCYWELSRILLSVILHQCARKSEELLKVRPQKSLQIKILAVKGNVSIIDESTLSV